MPFFIWTKHSTGGTIRFAMPDYMDARLRDRLKAFCKTGRLFDAERLLKEAGTARLRKTKKWTPLFTAVDRGFHSLVELLLRYDHAQWDLEKAYEKAHRIHRPDLAALILGSGSWSAPTDPVEVLATGDVGVARKHYDAGTDFTTGDTILRAAMRNARGVLAILNDLGLRSGEVDEQLYSAMVSYANQGNVASVIHFLRAGFDPHREAPYLDERGRFSGEKASAVYLAMHSDKPGFLAVLKPNPEKDDPVVLIRTAVFLGDDRLLRILLDAGFTLNCKANGGSPALDELMGGRTLKHHLPMMGYERRHEPPRYSPVEAEAFLRAIESFVLQGARWVPEKDRNEVRLVRDTLLALGHYHVVRLLEMLDKHGAAKREDIKTLFTADRMKSLAQVTRGSLPWL